MSTFTNTGFQKLEAKLKRFNLSRVGDIIVKGNKDNYRNSLNADGTGMKPLSALTVIEKTRLKARHPQRPLVRTEQLMNAIEKRELNKNQGQVSVLDKLRSGGITNTGILSIQKKYGRAPFGLGNIIERVRKYVKSAHEVQ